MSKVYSIDIETTGLDKYTDTITCIGVYGKDHSIVYRDLDAFVTAFREVYSKGNVIGQNFGFDIGFIAEYTSLTAEELLKSWYADTKSMGHVHHKSVTDKYLESYERRRREENKKLPKGYSHRNAGKLSLKTMAPFFLGVKAFWEDPTNHDSDEYVLKDCEYTYRLYEYFTNNFSTAAKEFYFSNIMQWDKMLYIATDRGINLNLEELDLAIIEYKIQSDSLYKSLRDAWSSPFAEYELIKRKEIKENYRSKTIVAVEKLKDKSKAPATVERYRQLMNKAIEKADFELNLDSPMQLAWLLRDYFGLDITDMEGNESTGKAVLEKLADGGREDIRLFSTYRKTKKVQTSFLPSYRELAHNGVVHPRFNLTGTRTGRLSCSSPNFQQQPSDLYKVFKPREGYTFLQYDYGSIEAVLIALYSEDSVLNTIVAKGGSLHNYNAKALFNLDCDVKDIPEKFPNERKIAKTIGFSILYGAGKFRVQMAFAAAGIILTDEEANKKVKQIRTMFADAKEFHREVTGLFESGEVIENLLGRPICIENSEEAYMKGFNTLIQSSASDLLLDASYKASVRFKEKGLDATPVAFIHDFIMVEVKDEHAKEANKILVDALLGYDLENKFGKLNLSVDGHIDKIWRK